MATALQVGISEGQIKDLGLKLIGHAVRTAIREGVCVKETPENIKFYKMCGIYLDEVNDPEKLDLARMKLERERRSGEYENIFAFESETIMAHISYHAYRMTSGPHSFLSMFASRRAFSGTPLPETCPISMQSRYIPEVGSEGQVMALLLDRNSDHSHVHAINSIDPVSMIEKVMRLYGEKPERVSMLLDPAGLFKDFGTLEVALQVRDYLRAAGAKFKGVLFFARPFKPLNVDFLNPNYMQDGVKRELDYHLGPDKLAFLSFYSNDVVYLSGTEESSLALLGLVPGDYFVICDERHTIGTNIKMTPDAVAIMTMNERVTHSMGCQAVMRLRQYTSAQDLHVMVPEKTVERFGTSIIEMMIRATALEKCMVMLRSFYQKVDNVTNEMAVNLMMDRLLKGESFQMVKKIRNELIPCLVYEIQDNPLLYLHGEISEVQTARIIKNRFIKRKEEFKAILLKLSIPFAPYELQFREAWASLQEEIEASAFLPATERIKIGSDDFGQQVEQLTEVAEVVRELQIENQVEILQQIQRINALYNTNKIARNQTKWSKSAAGAFLQKIMNEDEWSQGGLRVKSFESFFV